MLSLGALLRQHREVAGLSQVQVEERTGITQGHVSAIERGSRAPSLDVLRRLIALYDVSPEAAGALLVCPPPAPTTPASAAS